MPTDSSDALLVSLPALAEGAAYSTAVAAAIVLALALIVVTQFRRPGRAPKPEAPPPTGQSAKTPRRRQTANPALRRLADLAARIRRHRFHASPGLNFLGWFAVPLAPVWAALLIATMLGLARLWGSFFFPAAPIDNTDLRWLALATVGLMTALAGLVGTPLALIRVFTTERQTRTAEENLTTELINKAVAALGTEKTVKERGQERTVPNIEVRVGALYQLERLAYASAHSGRPEGAADHLRIMKILCAYVRENAPATKAVDLNMPPWPDYPENASAEDLKARAEDLEARRKDLTDKIATIQANHKPRTDIQTALEVIGRRDARQTKIERAAKGPGQEDGYRLDLRATNLQAADLSHLNLDRALLNEARMEGADFREARMEGADLGGARMEGADLGGARMEGADLGGARMEGADLSEAQMKKADLRWAGLERADLGGARMQGADLGGARMEGTDLGGARMEGADLSGAQMQGADLSEAHICDGIWGGLLCWPQPLGLRISEAAAVSIRRACLRWSEMPQPCCRRRPLASRTFGCRTNGVSSRRPSVACAIRGLVSATRRSGSARPARCR